ncbi:hypothetical protein D7W81_40865, partial [Corallococcus aberystwythensis]
PLDALCEETCAGDAACPSGLLCVAAGGAPARCLLPTLQAGTYGAACTEDAACGARGVCARLEADDGDDACRCFTPCEATVDPLTPDFDRPDVRCGCGGGPGALGATLAVLLGLFWRRPRRRVAGGTPGSRFRAVLRVKAPTKPQV